MAAMWIGLGPALASAAPNVVNRPAGAAVADRTLCGSLVHYDVGTPIGLFALRDDAGAFTYLGPSSPGASGGLLAQLATMVGDSVCVSALVLGTGSFEPTYFFTPASSATPRPPVRDLAATRCEIFIDKMAPVYEPGTPGRDGVTKQGGSLDTFLKIRATELDGAVVAVRLYGHVVGDVTETDRTQNVDSWLGADDYFNISIPVGWQGAAYVETTSGSRYWANPAGGGNFDLDRAWFRDLEQTVGWYGTRLVSEDHQLLSLGDVGNSLETTQQLDVGALPGTALTAPYLNPVGCR
jgi:hypothetical protein